AAPARFVLNVRMPQEDALLRIDGNLSRGQGTRRSVEARVPAGKEAVTVTAVWEPNNYTRITRRRNVRARPGTVEVDLSVADPKQPDDIVIRYVPTPQDVVEAMCRLAKVGRADVVYDLGCGDGRMVITAVKQFGAKRGVGIDINKDLIKE